MQTIIMLVDVLSLGGGVVGRLDGLKPFHTPHYCCSHYNSKWSYNQASCMHRACLNSYHAVKCNTKMLLQHFSLWPSAHDNPLQNATPSLLSLSVLLHCIVLCLNCIPCTFNLWLIFFFSFSHITLFCSTLHTFTQSITLMYVHQVCISGSQVKATSCCHNTGHI